MLELLQPKKGDKILDVGTGSGWTTALLAHTVGNTGQVYGVELHKELVTFGKKNLSKYSFLNVEINEASKTLGIPKKAPFDKILVSAESKDMPSELIQQLKNNGRMVIPIKNDVVVIDKNKQGKIHTKKIWGFSFVPLIQ
jgi:protein-L-isoaspartate(D-aspartate) O-methyltransferase